MGITLSQAGKRIGKGRSTLLRHISEGRLSASKDENSRWIVEESELARVYPEAFASLGKEVSKNRLDGAPMGAHVGRSGETAGELAVRVEMLTEQLERERRERADLRDELREVREELKTAHNKISGLLEAPRNQPRSNSLKGTWQRIWGKFSN